MAKKKKILNKTNSSGWLDDYSEEFVVNEYQQGGIIRKTLPEVIIKGQRKPINNSIKTIDDYIKIYGDRDTKLQQGITKQINDENYKNLISDVKSSLISLVDPTGITSYNDVQNAWNDNKVDYNDILQPIGALPYLGRITKLGTAQSFLDSKKWAKAYKIASKSPQLSNIVNKSHKLYNTVIDKPVTELTKHLQSNSFLKNYINPQSYNFNPNSYNNTIKTLNTLNVGGEFNNLLKERQGEIIPFQNGGKVNDNNGYLISNLDNFTPKKIINSNYITTNNMAFPVEANGVVLYPNTGDYIFPTNKVTETPIMQDGGSIYNDMKNKFKKYPAGGYLDYQEGFKGFGVGPQLYQDNSYFRSVMPDNIENMEEEINKPSVFSGINNILGGIDQIASKGIGLAGNFMQSKMPGAMGNMKGYEGLSGDAKESFDFNKLLNFAEGKTGSNLIDTDLESIAGRISGGMSGDGQVFGGLLGGGGNKGILQGMSLLGQKNGGYLKQYQNGGMIDMLPVGYPEYIHKSNVFHENYNPVPRVHFTDDTTPYDMGVNLNDLVNMNGGRINKYQNGGSMDLQGYFNYLTNQSQNRVPSRAFNANTNRASLNQLESANANDFLNTKVRNDRQAFEDDKVDWGFMDWAKEPAGAGLGLLSSVPVLGDTVKDVVGDSFLTRTSGYQVGKGAGNVGLGAAKLVAGIPKGDVSMIMGGIGDIGEGVGSTVGNLNAKSAMGDYNKQGYVSGKRLANAAVDFNTTMGLSSKLYGTGKSIVDVANDPSGQNFQTLLNNRNPYNRANKGQNDLNFLMGQFMPRLNGSGGAEGEMAMGGYLNNYQEGGMVSMPEDFEIAKFKKGGLTPAKAEKMLHDKSFTTDKQRKYFGYISSQKKTSGGWLDEI
jgi:hypothetical protein